MDIGLIERGTPSTSCRVQSDLCLLGIAGGFLRGGQTPTREVKNAKKNCRLALRHDGGET